MLCPPWLSFILYNPIRKAFTDRDAVMDECGIMSGSVVLEVGAGNGFFTEAIARRAARVVAVELQDGMVRKLKKRVGHFTDTVEIVSGDVATIPFAEAAADVCLLYYSFHEIGSQAPAAVNIARAVKPGGVLAIYEPSIEVSASGMDSTVRIFTDAGFDPQTRRDGFMTRFARMTRRGTGEKTGRG